jgi:hypothetical protein
VLPSDGNSGLTIRTVPKLQLQRLRALQSQRENDATMTTHSSSAAPFGEEANPQQDCSSILRVSFSDLSIRFQMVSQTVAERIELLRRQPHRSMQLQLQLPFVVSCTSSMYPLSFVLSVRLLVTPTLSPPQASAAATKQTSSNATSSASIKQEAEEPPSTANRQQHHAAVPGPPSSIIARASGWLWTARSLDLPEIMKALAEGQFLNFNLGGSGAPLLMNLVSVCVSHLCEHIERRLELLAQGFRLREAHSHEEIKGPLTDLLAEYQRLPEPWMLAQYYTHHGIPLTVESMKVALQNMRNASPDERPEKNSTNNNQRSVLASDEQTETRRGRPTKKRPRHDEEDGQATCNIPGVKQEERDGALSSNGEGWREGDILRQGIRLLDYIRTMPVAADPQQGRETNPSVERVAVSTKTELTEDSDSDSGNGGSAVLPLPIDEFWTSYMPKRFNKNKPAIRAMDLAKSFFTKEGRSPSNAELPGLLRNPRWY